MTCFYAGFLLTSGLYFTEPNETGRLAMQYSSLATYKACGIEKQVEPQIKKLEDIYIPKSLQKLGIGGTFIYRLVKDQKIEHTWEF